MRRAALLAFVAACGGSVDAPDSASATSSATSSGASSSSGVPVTTGNAGAAGEGGGGATSGPGGAGGRAAVCGDGTIDPGEACDDGNTANGDACSDACAITLIAVTSPNTDNAIYPDVAATSHDGGKGFLLAWFSSFGALSSVATAVGAAGSLGAPAPILDAAGLLTVAAVPGGEALMLQSACGGGLCAAFLDPSTLVASSTVSLDLPDVGYAQVPVRADASGRLGLAFLGPWDAGQGSRPLEGCVADPDFACATIGVSTIEQSGGAVVVLQDQFAFVTSGATGFDVTLFDGMGSLGVLPSIDEPSLPLSFDVAPRPGGFVAAWNAAAEESVHARLFDVDLAPLGPAVMVDQSCTGAPYQPRVATGPTGRFVVAYWRIDPGAGPPPCSVHAQVFEADGAPSGPAFEVSELSGCNQDVRIAANPDGDVLLAWNRDDGLHDVIEAKLLPRLVE